MPLAFINNLIVNRRRLRERQQKGRILDPRLGLLDYHEEPPEENPTCRGCGRKKGICVIIDRTTGQRSVTTVPICPKLHHYQGSELIVLAPPYRRDPESEYCPDHFQMTSNIRGRNWHKCGELAKDRCLCCIGQCPIAGCRRPGTTDDGSPSSGDPPPPPDRPSPRG